MENANSLISKVNDMDQKLQIQIQILKEENAELKNLLKELIKS